MTRSPSAPGPEASDQSDLEPDSGQDRGALRADELEGFRLRTALELHDGVLQTLTGAALQIAVARKLLQDDPERADDVLAKLGASVSAEQQELRLYVDELKGTGSEWTEDSRGFVQRVGVLLDRVGAIWGIDVIARSYGELRFGTALSRQLIRMVQEATVNAARHAGASSVEVTIDGREDRIRITIVDDGRGFAFIGSYGDDELREQRLGPLSLKHRVWEAQGTLNIESSAEGSTVRIRIPLPIESAEGSDDGRTGS